LQLGCKSQPQKNGLQLARGPGSARQSWLTPLGRDFQENRSETGKRFGWVAKRAFQSLDVLGGREAVMLTTPADKLAQFRLGLLSRKNRFFL
jgi:hypothetical protein